jgi:2-methylisocitrate lyase-like PEP mutase family enzyme
MTAQSKGRQLKNLIEQRAALPLIGIWDGFSAHLVEQSGYKAALVSGAAVSESRLGRPDVGIMGLDDNAAAVRAIADCTGLLLLGDGDTGYGNAVNVHFTVQMFERAGAAGVMIEDQVFPKRCGHMAGKQVIPAEEMVAKVRAAVDAKTDPDFVIRARTDAAGPLGIEEAIRRANMYADAGADLVFADALLSEDDVRAFAEGVKAPVAINMGFGIRSRPTTPLMSFKQLRDLKIAVVDLPRMLTGAGLRGMQNALGVFAESLAGQEIGDRTDLVASFDEINKLMGLSEITEMEARYS